MGRDAGVRDLRQWVGADEPRDLTRSCASVLQLVRPGDSPTVEVFWDEAWSLLGWYVSLQAPPSPIGRHDVRELVGRDF